MNKYKNKILSLVLLSLTFFVVHDYVIESFSQGVQHVTYSSEYDSATTDAKIKQDVYSDLHDNVHTMLNINLHPTEPIQLTFLNLKPSTHETSSISYITPVPNKPPVI